ncbi:GNAT family N-acetyltransferase [Flavobacterium sp. HSC-61S13]|uniref:GNAT family N-acetyltransferase n=1 Tax=Flavobacterium sp. HSC-61S13 TaxID=2910963 RepID=UPI0020A069E6|nr:GNAT family N-acetyltransferase [Flavobacterium sp. HSC-61S13]MCP1997032.1 ribosomal-protein-alanine N-acetyltransferase [Flavobacterium sp. HSC-61S13]
MNIPPYQNFPVLRGDKVSLRPIEFGDLQHILEISFYNAIPASTVEEALTMQDKIHQDYRNGTSIHWGIFDNRSNKIVGTCGYYRGFTDGAGELGCVLLPPFYGNGFMTAAMEIAMEFGRNTMKLNRIFAITTASNIKAIQLLHRLNFSLIAELEADDLEFEWNGNGIKTD